MKIEVSFLFIIITLMSQVTYSADPCFTPSPLKKKSGQAFEEIKPVKLTNKQTHNISNMFKNLRGNWRGTATGFFCLGTEKKPRQKPDNYSLKADVDVFSQQDIEITANMESTAQSKQRTETFRLFSSNGFLRYNRNHPAGDVKVNSISRNEISFTQHSQIRLHPKSTLTEDDVKSNVNNNGGTVRREIITTLKRTYKNLQIEYKVYSNGVLGSVSTWKLQKL